MANRKLSGDDRIDEIVDAVEVMIVRDRTLAFNMHQVASEIAVSRALIYVYFESVQQIVDALCHRHALALIKHLNRAGGQGDAIARANALGQGYLSYLIEHGPALHYILRDSDRNGQLQKSRPLLRNLIRSVTGEARILLQVEWREALVLVELLLAIPETLAGHIRRQAIDVTVARETCERLIADLVTELSVIR